jgi:hypothetical protein
MRDHHPYTILAARFLPLLQVEMQNNHFSFVSVFEKSRMTSLSNKLMANKKGARMRPSDLINFCFNHSL